MKNNFLFILLIQSLEELISEIALKLELGYVRIDMLKTSCLIQEKYLRYSLFITEMKR